MRKDYYATLGVPRDASQDDIKRAFRRMARETHPDANPNDPGTAAFREVAEAYEVLNDPARRRAYDRGEVFDFGDLFGGGGLEDLIRSVFGESNFFGDGGFFANTRPAPLRGRDLLVRAEVDLFVAAFGGETEVSLRTSVDCDVCAGEGAAPGTQAITCPTCGGTGTVRIARRGLLGTMMTVSSCGTCGGLGTVVAEACRECRGSGFVDGQRTVRVEVPAGVSDGARLRLTGLGESVGRRGSPGDLHVEIHSRPHPHLVRAGDDLVYVTSVGVAGAVLGATMEVPLLEGGTERLDVPAGTQPGAEFRLKGLGANHLGRRGRGDMRVIVNVDIPTNLSNEEEDALREFARLRGEEHRQPARRRWGK